MWVNLEARDIDAIVEKFGDGPVVDKVLARPDRETGSFLLAAEAKFFNDRNFLVDDDAIVKRDRGGAWVMNWAWIDEVAANVPPALEYHLLNEGTALAIRALERFRIGTIGDPEDTRLRILGYIDGREWCFEAFDTCWAFEIRQSSKSIWSHSELWTRDCRSCDMAHGDIFECLLKAIGLWQSRPIDDLYPTPYINESRYIRRLALGDIGPGEVADLTGLPRDVVYAWVGKLLSGSTNVAVSRGPLGELSFTGSRIHGLDTERYLPDYNVYDMDDEDDVD